MKISFTILLLSVQYILINAAFVEKIQEPSLIEVLVQHITKYISSLNTYSVNMFDIVEIKDNTTNQELLYSHTIRTDCIKIRRDVSKTNLILVKAKIFTQGDYAKIVFNDTTLYLFKYEEYNWNYRLGQIRRVFSHFDEDDITYSYFKTPKNIFIDTFFNKNKMFENITNPRIDSYRQNNVTTRLDVMFKCKSAQFASNADDFIEWKEYPYFAIFWKYNYLPIYGKI